MCMCAEHEAFSNLAIHFSTLSTYCVNPLEVAYPDHSCQKWVLCRNSFLDNNWSHKTKGFEKTVCCCKDSMPGE